MADNIDIKYIVVTQDGTAQLFTQEDMEKSLADCELPAFTKVYTIKDVGEIRHHSAIHYNSITEGVSKAPAEKTYFGGNLENEE